MPFGPGCVGCCTQRLAIFSPPRNGCPSEPSIRPSAHALAERRRRAVRVQPPTAARRLLCRRRRDVKDTVANIKGSRPRLQRRPHAGILSAGTTFHVEEGAVSPVGRGTGRPAGPERAVRANLDLEEASVAFHPPGRMGRQRGLREASVRALRSKPMGFGPTRWSPAATGDRTSSLSGPGSVTTPSRRPFRTGSKLLPYVFLRDLG
jgi:hypothetical protein